MWVGIVFFSYVTVAVVVLNDMWSARYIGVLANGALAAGTWVSIAFKRPFTVEYAREHTDSSLGASPLFLRTNNILTAIWGAAFTINASLALQKSIQPKMPDWGYESISYSLLMLAMVVSTWYPAYVRRSREAGSGYVGGGGRDLRGAD